VNVTGVAFVPMTPLMFRHLSGAADPLAELRDAAVQAVRDACEGAAQVVVLCPVGGREAPGDWRDPSHSGAVHGEPRSLAAQVGAHLLALAGGGPGTTSFAEVDDPDGFHVSTASTVEADGIEVELPLALVVLGDGAAARGQGAPGHIDDRSFAYDDRVAELLAAGDATGLAGLDATLGAELMATGRLSWPAVATFVPKAAEAELRWRGDPFGLSYFVAVWRP
jgi:hypothetical protein